MRRLTREYDEIRRLRLTGDCAGAIALLRTRPPRSDGDAFEAVVCLFVCGEIDNALHVCRTHPWKKKWAAQITAALSRGFNSADVEGALALARAAAADPEAPADASALYLLLLQQANRVEDAQAYIERTFRELPAGESFLLTIIAEIALAAGQWREAYRAACGVLALDPYDYRARLVLSIVNYEIGNVHEALGNAVHASVLRKGAAPAVLQVMRCRNDLGNHYAAIAACDTLSADAAANAEIQVELGRAYRGLGDRERAISAYREALASGTQPIEALRALIAMHSAAGAAGEIDALMRDHGGAIERDVECLCSLGLAALNRGELDRAAQLFRSTHALGDAAGEPSRDLPWPVPEPRVRHDREQLALLAQRGRLDAAGKQALAVLEAYRTENADAEIKFAPTGAEAAALKQALCTTFHVPDRAFSGPALGANDYPAIEAEYRAKRLVVIDNFLAPEALQALRQHCEEATVWKMNYERGYVGALLAQGFSPRVLLEIAQQLKQAMPGVLGDQPLMQAWAFKYDQRLHGINMHADFAEVNVNFWITPDEACEDPETGGMVIYDVPVPRHWTFFEYNNESEKLAAYVKVHGAKPQRVPYRANRCVLFDSSLIHITDEIHFRPGYENRRVNVTLLYGTPRNVG